MNDNGELLTYHRVNMYVSDLFFNLDFGQCTVETKEGIDYDNAKLLEEAAWFIECLDRLGVKNLPLPGDVVSDFRRRL
jgi:hypothetical protein